MAALLPSRLYCTPAMIYLAIAFIVIISSIGTIPYYIIAIQIIFDLLWAWFLNFLCDSGYAAFSWILVFFPFIFMLLTILIFMAFFGMISTSMMMMPNESVPNNALPNNMVQNNIVPIPNNMMMPNESVPNYAMPNNMMMPNESVPNYAMPNNINVNSINANSINANSINAMNTTFSPISL
jgi:hypothetical protein